MKTMQRDWAPASRRVDGAESAAVGAGSAGAGSQGPLAVEDGVGGFHDLDGGDDGGGGGGGCRG